MNNVIINFPEQYFTMEEDGKVSRHHFAYDNNFRSIDKGDLNPANQSTKTGVDCMQVAASLMTNRPTADYNNLYLQNEAVSETDVGPRSKSKDKIRGCLIGERASGDDDDKHMIYDSEQVTRYSRNVCCSNDGTSDDHKFDRRGEELMNNYEVFTASRLGRYKEGDTINTEPVTDTHNTVTDDRAITTDQIRELINGMENLTLNQKQKLTTVLMRHQGNLTKKPGKCRSIEYTFQVQGQLLKSTYSRPLPFALRPAITEEIRQLLKDDILEESHSA